MTESTNKKLIARWQSRGGKYALNLYQLSFGEFTGFEYHGSDGGGNMGDQRYGMNKEIAITQCESRAGIYPSKMTRVSVED